MQGRRERDYVSNKIASSSVNTFELCVNIHLSLAFKTHGSRTLIWSLIPLQSPCLK